MDREVLKEAVEILSKQLSGVQAVDVRSIERLLDLATLYLSNKIGEYAGEGEIEQALIKFSDETYENKASDIKLIMGNDFKNLATALANKIPKKVGREFIISAVVDYFSKLEKETSKKQIAEVDKKGLWNADLISNSFDEIANSLADAILERMEGK